MLPYPTNDDIEQVVSSLPAAPRILARLTSKLRDPSSDLTDITAVLRQDSGLSVRLIDVASSAAYSGYEPATSVEDAVARIGFTETCMLIGTIAAHQLADRPLGWYGVSARQLRENSLFCALVLEDLAEWVGLDDGTAYAVGLLRSIGKIVLDRVTVPDVHRRVFDPQRESLQSWEAQMWGTSNVEVAAQALSLWRFPPAVVAATRRQYAPRGPLDVALNWSAGAADEAGFGLPGEHGRWCTAAELMVVTSVSEERLQRTLERTTAMVSRVSPDIA